MIEHYLLEGIATGMLAYSVLYTKNVLMVGIVYILLLLAGSAATRGFCNPALTFMMAVAGNLSSSQVVGYWVAQVVGALIALQIYVTSTRV